MSWEQRRRALGDRTRLVVGGVADAAPELGGLVADSVIGEGPHRRDAGADRRLNPEMFQAAAAAVYGGEQVGVKPVQLPP